MDLSKTKLLALNTKCFLYLLQDLTSPWSNFNNLDTAVAISCRSPLANQNRQSSNSYPFRSRQYSSLVVDSDRDMHHRFGANLRGNYFSWNPVSFLISPLFFNFRLVDKRLLFCLDAHARNLIFAFALFGVLFSQNIRRNWRHQNQYRPTHAIQ